MNALVPHYDPWGVAGSVLIATFASYVALGLAKRVRTPDRNGAFAWWAGGSLVMGSGMWSMHFVGMMAFSLPIALGYTPIWTFASWLAGVAVSGIALFLAGRGRLTIRRLVAGALAMGAGICAMHYTGMAALDVAPGIVWDARLVVASALIAATASAAALVLFFRLPDVSALYGPAAEVGAAVVMGLAISGMHYTAMAAASFPVGSICLSAGELASGKLQSLVVVVTVGMLGCTWVVSVIDARLQSKAARLADSLRQANLQLKDANEELKRRAFLDPLTDLPNRKLFEDRLARAAGRSPRVGERHAEGPHPRLAVLFVDLDGFKPVNDSFGHDVGDLVLKEVAARLCREARSCDTVARVGGDEFLLLMEDADDAHDCRALAERLCQAMREPFCVAEGKVEISASIGIATFPDLSDRDRLIARADAAMYAAKRAGGNTFAVFETHMDADASCQLSLQADLRHASERGELALYYQPKIDAQGGQIHGVEALLRWHHPTRGLLGPTSFIPLAERLGFIGKIGHWVLDEACRQMRDWSERGMHVRVAINLSASQLREADLAERIERAMSDNGIEPSRLLCEITESVAMEDIAATLRAFEALARIGVFLSIDDFGTGYSSLSHLRQLPARQLKIDRCFVKDLEASQDARAIVDAVVRLAHALGLRVVAEGVETSGQRDILLGLGCDELQGFLFARPMPAADLLQWLFDGPPASEPSFAPSIIDETMRA